MLTEGKKEKEKENMETMKKFGVFGPSRKLGRAFQKLLFGVYMKSGWWSSTVMTKIVFRLLLYAFIQTPKKWPRMG